MPTPRSPRDQALRHAEAKDFAAAHAALADALAATENAEERSAIAGTLGEVARRAEQAGQLDAAQSALELAATVVEWADLLCRLGCLYARRGRGAEARIALDR